MHSVRRVMDEPTGLARKDPVGSIPSGNEWEQGVLDSLIDKALSIFKSQIQFFGIRVKKTVDPMILGSEFIPDFMGFLTHLLGQSILSLHHAPRPLDLEIVVSCQDGHGISGLIRDSGRVMSGASREEWLETLSPWARLDLPGRAEVTFDTDADQGNILRFRLPIPVLRLQKSRPKRALIIDDCRITTAVVSKLLASLDCHVTSIDDGMRASVLLREQRFDVIILDVVLPGIGGNLLYALLTQEMPEMLDRCLVVSGSGDRPDFLKSRDSHFLPKPLEPTTFLETVKSILEGSPAVGPPSLEHDPEKMEYPLGRADSGAGLPHSPKCAALPAASGIPEAVETERSSGSRIQPSATPLESSGGAWEDRSGKPLQERVRSYPENGNVLPVALPSAQLLIFSKNGETCRTVAQSVRSWGIVPSVAQSLLETITRLDSMDDPLVLVEIDSMDQDLISRSEILKRIHTRPEPFIVLCSKVRASRALEKIENLSLLSTPLDASQFHQVIATKLAARLPRRPED